MYDALTGAGATLADGAAAAAQLPDAVKRIALAIEVFHKASLVHDDVEDDDSVATACPRCTASMASPRRSTSAIT